MGLYCTRVRFHPAAVAWHRRSSPRKNSAPESIEPPLVLHFTDHKAVKGKRNPLIESYEFRQIKHCTHVLSLIYMREWTMSRVICGKNDPRCFAHSSRFSPWRCVDIFCKGNGLPGILCCEPLGRKSAESARVFPPKPVLSTRVRVSEPVSRVKRVRELVWLRTRMGPF